jgi:hypothetical protein
MKKTYVPKYLSKAKLKGKIFEKINLVTDKSTLRLIIAMLNECIDFQESKKIK